MWMLKFQLHFLLPIALSPQLTSAGICESIQLCVLHNNQMSFWYFKSCDVDVANHPWTTIDPSRPVKLVAYRRVFDASVEIHHLDNAPW